MTPTNLEAMPPPDPATYSDAATLIGEASIDREHRELFALLDRMKRSQDASPHSEQFVDDIGKIGQLLFAHFDNEEKFMRSCGMPLRDVDEHSRAHDEILQQYIELSLRSMESTARGFCGMLMMLRESIVEHLIRHHDQLRQCLNA